MPVIDIKSKPEFDALTQATPYVALQAHATWCGPCKAISPLFTKHADALAVPEKFVFARFDTDEVPDLAMELGIRSIPAFYVFENGEKSETLTGANPPALQKLAEATAEKAKTVSTTA
ncbi:thioredoxin [Trichoderma parareesei]|uniref:Thioredoxin n=1 Tax=Trichoderma parareesei TaxID=858221 RepID=A0A2H2ZE83_TRIPA|nr:thioredoxin [Trichoderma parareesei]